MPRSTEDAASGRTRVALRRLVPARPSASASARTSTSGDRAAEFATVRDLWARQLAHAAERGLDSDPGMAYLGAHFSMDLTLERHLRVIDLLMPFVGGRVLEWGCRHALDSCVYRLRLGEAVELHGCDVCDGDDYRPFHEFSGLDYRRLDHPYLLPYGDAEFDAVTSNGVLEHVPDDDRSVGEVFRVLKPGGAFLVTCLPNRWSYTEALQRWRGGDAHDRLYTVSGLCAMLRAHGFAVTDVRRLFLVPTMLNGLPARAKAAYQRSSRAVWAVNDLLERLWPLHLLASNLMAVAFKPDAG